MSQVPRRGPSSSAITPVLIAAGGAAAITAGIMATGAAFPVAVRTPVAWVRAADVLRYFTFVFLAYLPPAFVASLLVTLIGARFQRRETRDPIRLLPWAVAVPLAVIAVLASIRSADRNIIWLLGDHAADVVSGVAAAVGRNAGWLPVVREIFQATVETDFISTPNYFMDWIESGRLMANPPWSDDTVSGIYGDGRLGTADKGRRWLEAAVAERVESVREVSEQHRRREAKRLAAASGH